MNTTKPISRWRPDSSEIRDHTGAPLGLDSPDSPVFFAPPPPEIGAVRTAHSGVSSRGSVMAKPMARKVVGLFTLLGALPGGLVGAAVVPSGGGGAWWGALLGAIVGGGLLGGLLYRREGRKRDCTFTGTLGIARFPFPRSSRPNLLRFADAVELQTAFLGRNMGTNFDFRWKDARGKTIYRLEGGYYGNARDGDPDSVYHFAVAAERAWNAYKLPEFRAQIERQGSARFCLSRVLGKAQYASVGRGFFEFDYANRRVRLTPSEIESMSIHQGILVIRRIGARDRAIVSRSGEDGIYYLSYGAFANVGLFLHLLEEAAGITCGASPETAEPNGGTC